MTKKVKYFPTLGRREALEFCKNGEFMNRLNPKFDESYPAAAGRRRAYIKMYGFTEEDLFPAKPSDLALTRPIKYGDNHRKRKGKA